MDPVCTLPAAINYLDYFLLEVEKWTSVTTPDVPESLFFFQYMYTRMLEKGH